MELLRALDDSGQVGHLDDTWKSSTTVFVLTTVERIFLTHLSGHQIPGMVCL